VLGFDRLAEKCACQSAEGFGILRGGVAAAAVDRIISGTSKKTVNNVDIVGYLERCERIRKDNPDMSAELSREIFGGASEIFMTE